MSSIDRHVGTRLRERRQLLGMSIEEVAAALGIPETEVRKLEVGSVRASAAQIQTLCSLLGVEPADIYGGWP